MILCEDAGKVRIGLLCREKKWESANIENHQYRENRQYALPSHFNHSHTAWESSHPGLPPSPQNWASASG